MRIRDLWNGVSAKEAIKEFATAILVVVGIWAYIWTLDITGLLGQ